MRIIATALFISLAGCVDLASICPYGDKIITQGVFGEITDSSGAVEQGVEVTISTIDANHNPVMQFGDTTTGRAGYQFNATGPAMYSVCAKSVCTIVSVSSATALVELSAVDGATLVWSAQTAVPPDVTIGACTFGG